MLPLLRGTTAPGTVGGTCAGVGAGGAMGEEHAVSKAAAATVLR